MSESALYRSSYCAFLPAASLFVKLQKESGEDCCRERDVCMLNFFLLRVNLYVLVVEVFPFKVSHWACINRLKRSALS